MVQLFGSTASKVTVRHLLRSAAPRVAELRELKRNNIGDLTKGDVI